MHKSKEQVNRKQNRRFKIEKLEPRIAPRHHCGVLAEVPANEAAAQGLAEAQARSGCIG